MGPFERGSDPTCQRNVVVLDEHAVGEIEPVILSPAATHRIFVDHAQARRGFAGIENSRLGARDGIHKLAGQRGDPAHALQEIQNHALAGKNHARVVPDDRDRLPFVQAHSIENLGMGGDFVVGCHRAIERRVNIENARNATDSREMQSCLARMVAEARWLGSMHA